MAQLSEYGTELVVGLYAYAEANTNKPINRQNLLNGQPNYSARQLCCSCYGLRQQLNEMSVQIENYY